MNITVRVPVLPLMLVLAFGTVLCAGCMAPRSTPVAPVTLPVTPPVPQTTTEPAVLPTAPPAPVTPAAIPDTAAASGTPVTPAPTPAPAYFTAVGEPDNPWLQYLVFTKSYFPFTVPDCTMQELFPELAQDPYGIRQPVPKLEALSADRMDTFIREYANGNPSPPAGTGCAAEPAGRDWNFVKIEGIVVPRNARPAGYDSLLEVRSQGRIIAGFTNRETLVPGQPYSFTWYVPLRTDEMDLFDSIELLFHRNA